LNAYQWLWDWCENCGIWLLENRRDTGRRTGRLNWCCQWPEWMARSLVPEKWPVSSRCPRRTRHQLVITLLL
jgi:hypothetical protein